MPKMISDPEDKNPGKGYKPEKLGSAIRVDGKPLKDEAPAKKSKAEADSSSDRVAKMMRDAEPMQDRPQMPRVNEMGDTYKKGGMTASSRADGIATKGKTRGTMIAMCGGGMSKGKR